jgi:hypothetical protein
VLILVAVAGILGACAGGTASVRPTDSAEESFPDPLPTIDDGDPFDTIPPEPSPTTEPTDAASPTRTDIGMTCSVVPTLVVPGQTWVLTVTEVGTWYGAERYFQVNGIPDGYRELETSDGGPKPHVLFAEAAPDLGGTNWVIDVFMRDWDIHGIRPGVASGPVRPATTQHEAACGASFQIGYLP